MTERQASLFDPPSTHEPPGRTESRQNAPKPPEPVVTTLERESAPGWADIMIDYLTGGKYGE